MDDFDYLDEVYQGAGGFSMPSFDFPDISPTDIDFSTFDFPSSGNIDFSGFYDPTDISDFFGGSGSIDFSSFYDPTDISDFFDGSSGLDLSGIVDPTDLGMPSTDAEAQEGGFYGNTDTAYYDPRTNTTTLYNTDGTLRDTIVHDEREYDVEKQEGGFYGNTPNATYDPKTNLTTIRDNNGNVTRQIPGPPIRVPGPGGTDRTITNTIKQFYDRVTGAGANKQDALLMALLGGLMGLLGKGSGTTGSKGYQGAIPKYTAVRGPAASPTAGGRRPGGAGIGSLAGTTKYIPAAAGGLMGLAGGGRPARYLRGGTDGMADKIKTDIDGKQPARLSHGEFVIPADVVSHLGNGNSDAGADVLYDMMAKVRKARTGNTKQGKQINPRQYTPA